jgi:hypothetical protein
MPSQVAIRTMVKPKMVTKRKLRRSCCALPMRVMSCWSCAVPFFSVVSVAETIGDSLGAMVVVW